MQAEVVKKTGPKAKRRLRFSVVCAPHIGGIPLTFSQGGLAELQSSPSLGDSTSVLTFGIVHEPVGPTHSFSFPSKRAFGIHDSSIVPFESIMRCCSEEAKYTPSR